MVMATWHAVSPARASSKRLSAWPTRWDGLRRTGSPEATGAVEERVPVETLLEVMHRGAGHGEMQTKCLLDD